MQEPQEINSQNSVNTRWQNTTQRYHTQDSTTLALYATSPFLLKIDTSLIFLANILCVHVRKSDQMYASLTWCTHAKKKKKATDVTVSGTLTLRSGAFIAPGPSMCSPLFLPKESCNKFAVVFVNVVHF